MKDLQLNMVIKHLLAAIKSSQMLRQQLILNSSYWEGLWGQHSGSEGAQYRKELFKQMGAQ